MKMTSVSERIRKESWHACIAPTQRHGAIRTLTRWIKRNNELYAELLLTGYHARVRTFMPRQVGIIVRYLNEP